MNSDKYIEKYRNLYRWEYMQKVTKLFQESDSSAKAWTAYYFYPWYDKLYDDFCDWWPFCDDLNFQEVKKVITNYCE
jgi:hypothetical protein